MSRIDETTLRRLKQRAFGPEPVDMVSKPGRRPRRLSQRRLRRAENDLGFSLPITLRQLYTEVANGGFGPGYGIIPLRAGSQSETGIDVVKEYQASRAPDPLDPDYSWPDRIVPICHWGCGIYSCVDCNDDQARIVRFDPNPVDEDWSIAWEDERHTLSEWLQAWLNGEELFIAATSQMNPTRPGEEAPDKQDPSDS